MNATVNYNNQSSRKTSSIIVIDYLNFQKVITRIEFYELTEPWYRKLRLPHSSQRIDHLQQVESIWTLPPQILNDRNIDLLSKVNLPDLLGRIRSHGQCGFAINIDSRKSSEIGGTQLVRLDCTPCSKNLTQVASIIIMNPYSYNSVKDSNVFTFVTSSRRYWACQHTILQYNSGQQEKILERIEVNGHCRVV